MGSREPGHGHRSPIPPAAGHRILEGDAGTRPAPTRGADHGRPEHRPRHAHRRDTPDTLAANKRLAVDSWT